MLAGWLPRGLVSPEPLKDTIRRVAGDDWAPHPKLWIVACDYETGRRVTFGREDAPPASLADAVAASCAIPGFYRPVEIGGRLYVDGGVWSTSNLEVLAGRGLDLVICLNPTSSLHAPRPRTLGERAAATLRQASGRRLGREAKRVRAAGGEVVLIQPTVQDLDAMGTNLMSRSRRNGVIEVAVRTVGEHLRQPEISARLRELPAGGGPLVRRPPGPASRGRTFVSWRKPAGQWGVRRAEGAWGFKPRASATRQDSRVSAVAFEHFRKVFGPTVAVERLDLSIPKGCITGCWGRMAPARRPVSARSAGC